MTRSGTLDPAFAGLFDAIPIGLYRSTPDGVILAANLPLADILGAPSREVLLATNAAAFYADPEGRRQFRADLTAAGVIRDFVTRMRRLDGRLIWARLNARAVLESGTVTYYEGSLEDVTEQRRAEDARRESEAALQQSEALFRSIVESASVGIYQTSADGAIIRANQALADLLGYDTPDEVMDLDMGRDVYWDPAERQALIARHEPGGQGTEIEVRWKRRDGTPVWVLLHARARRNSAGVTEYFEGFVLDIASRKRAEEAMRESQERLRQGQKIEAIGRLAGGIAHDFNNLLTAILGYSALLVDDDSVGESARESAREILKAGERAASLTQQLLAFSRRQVIQPESLDLNEVVEGMMPMIRRLIGEDLDLRTEPAAGVGRVRADRGQIEQVLLNFALNARDAMPMGGVLTVRTAEADFDAAALAPWAGVPPGRFSCLEVADTGTGMSAEIQARMFDPYFTTKPQGKGTGLGLSTAYGIVQQNGGFITVHSEVDRGTAVRMYLPHSAHPPTVAAAPRTSGGGRETILVVEDEDAVRSFAVRALRRMGYTVLEAGHGRAALEVADSHAGPIQLLLTDVIMPGMSGSELAAALTRARPDTAVLYMSGYTDDAMVRHGIVRQSAAFLQKPFTPDVLTAKVREVLETKRPAA